MSLGSKNAPAAVAITAMILLLVGWNYIAYVDGAARLIDPSFKLIKIFSGKFEASSLAFLGNDDFLILDRDHGKVFRVTSGKMTGPLLDVNVATDGYRGLLGIAVNTKSTTQRVFLYFTEARTKDGDDVTKDPIDPFGNRVYEYTLEQDKLVNPRLLITLPAMPGPRHAGGVLAIGPDNNLYLTIGDLDGTFREKKYETMAQNFNVGQPPDGRSGILVMSQNGAPTDKAQLGDYFPLHFYYAYGIRNSFGIDWDPLTGELWDSENGPNFGDEINLVQSGFNSGWAKVQGYWEPNIEDMGRPISGIPTNLVDFNGKGKYSSPEFVWINPVAPSAIKFLDSDLYGQKYKDDLLVGDANYGNIYDFDLDAQRINLALYGQLADRIANNIREVKDILFATDVGKIADLEISPDRYLYILSSENHGASVYKVIPS